MKLQNLFEAGVLPLSGITKVGKALGEQAYHDEMGGGQGGIWE